MHTSLLSISVLVSGRKPVAVIAAAYRYAEDFTLRLQAQQTKESWHKRIHRRHTELEWHRKMSEEAAQSVVDMALNRQGSSIIAVLRNRFLGFVAYVNAEIPVEHPR